MIDITFRVNDFDDEWTVEREPCQVPTCGDEVLLPVICNGEERMITAKVVCRRWEFNDRHGDNVSVNCYFSVTENRGDFVRSLAGHRAVELGT